MIDSAFMFLEHGLIWAGYLWPAPALGLVAWAAHRRQHNLLAYWVLGFVACHGVRYLTGRIWIPFEFSFDFSGPSRHIAMRHLGLGYAGIAIDLLISLPLIVWWHRMLDATRAGATDASAAL